MQTVYGRLKSTKYSGNRRLLKRHERRARRIGKRLGEQEGPKRPTTGGHVEENNNN